MASPAGYRSTQLVWLAAGVVDVILALDFIFKAAGANAVGFVQFIANVAGALAAPFAGIFSTRLGASGHYWDWADLVAIVVYSVAAWILATAIRIATGGTRNTVSTEI